MSGADYHFKCPAGLERFSEVKTRDLYGEKTGSIRKTGKKEEE